MIFVITGTIGFEDLIKGVDILVKDKKLKEKVVIQIGNSRYLPKYCEYFRFDKSLDSYYESARLVIAHGGAGTTFEVLEKRLPLISVNNPHRTDKHQEDILRALSKNKYLIWCKDLNKLADCISKAKNFKFKKYISPKCTIHNKINEFLK